MGDSDQCPIPAQTVREIIQHEAVGSNKVSLADIGMQVQLFRHMNFFVVDFDLTAEIV